MLWNCDGGTFSKILNKLSLANTLRPFIPPLRLSKPNLMLRTQLKLSHPCRFTPEHNLGMIVPTSKGLKLWQSGSQPSRAVALMWKTQLDDRLGNKYEVYFEKVRKMQHEKMQKIEDLDRQLKLAVENIKIQRRIYKLMEEQHKQEELEPIAFNPLPKRQLNFGRSRNTVRRKHYLNYARPTNSPPHSHLTHNNQWQLQQLQQLHFAPYSPAHPRSDNGDLLCKPTPKLEQRLNPILEMHRERAAQLDANKAASGQCRESAMCKLVKILNQKTIAKF
ncbi:uncharacterized protein LOC108606899 isoform X2 [Drosophila busckii]|nr:uncharacterized protein LOC108606899 isoform X2 [Drosophila busckii]